MHINFRFGSAGVRGLLPISVLLLITVLIYWPGLSGGFVFDDFGNLVNNPAFAPGAVHDHFRAAIWSSSSGPTGRPISMFTFALQDWFMDPAHGLQPWPLKFVNVLIHVVNGLLIYLITRSVLCFLFEGQKKLTDSDPWLIEPATLALLITAAWLFSPMQLTAVLYVIQRMESLSAFFVLSGLLLYWQGRIRLIAGESGAWWRILVGLLGGTVLAVLAKETGVILPVYAFLLELLVLRGLGERRVKPKLVVLYLLILVVPGIIGVLYTLPGAINGTSYAGRPFDLAERLWTEGRVLVDYLHWIFVPTPNALSLYHDDIPLSTGWLSPWTTALSWMLIVGLISLALWIKKRAPLFSLGVLWFFAGNALVSTYLPLELVYEHRNYLPSLGVFVALFGAIFAWGPKDVARRDLLRTVAVSAVLALIMLNAGLTALRAQIWGNPYRLAYFEETTHPNSPRASYDLARLMMIMAPSPTSRLFQLGVTQMEITAKLPGASLQAEQALIFMAAKNHLKVNTAWWDSLRYKISHRPMSADDVSAIYSLINCETEGACKYTQKAQDELGETVAFAFYRYPLDASVITLYANYAANIAHDFPLAFQLMQQAVKIAPNQFEYWKNLATLQIAADMLDDAQESIGNMHRLNRMGAHDVAIVSIEKLLADKTTSDTNK